MAPWKWFVLEHPIYVLIGSHNYHTSMHSVMTTNNVYRTLCVHTHYVYTLCLHTVCTHCVYTMCAHSVYTQCVCTYCVYSLCVHTVCTHTLCVYTLCVCTHCVYTLCAHSVYTQCVHTVCTHNVCTQCAHSVPCNSLAVHKSSPCTLDNLQTQVRTFHTTTQLTDKPRKSTPFATNRLRSLTTFKL